MPVPGFQEFMLPLLELAFDGQEHSLEEARNGMAVRFNLTEEDQNELLPTAKQTRFSNRVAWAKSYLQQAALLNSSRRGHFRITDRGRSVLGEKPSRIDIPFLERFAEFREFREAGKGEASAAVPPKKGTGEVEKETPEETLEQSYQSIRKDLASELLTKVKSSSPKFFETLVVELLLKMGYGRSRADAGKAIGASGDEGVDGIISEDRLGLDTIYIQAKRWDGTVGRPEIQKFVGALHGKRARKGVFITTGSFSLDARDYVSHIDPRVVLIDGRELADYLIDLDLGVSSKAIYAVKRLDSDFFADE
jgi:restriction system protein